MPLYEVEAERTTYYVIQVEAADEEEAEHKVFMEDLDDDIETYAVDWEPVQTTSVTEIDEED